MKYCLEVCVDSVESAIAAQDGGASRLELCENLIIGGTTPSPAFFQQVRQAVQIPIHVLIRPRFGDFLYSNAEQKQMAEEIRTLSVMGAECFVIGALKENGEMDENVLRYLMAAAPTAQFALHRAFDMTCDREAALNMAINLGIGTILTSGGEASAAEGAKQICRLVEQAAGRLEIMAGAGVASSNLADLVAKTGASAYHMSGKKMVESGMIYRNPRVFMGLKDMSEYEKYITDEAEIRRAVQVLDQCGMDRYDGGVRCQHFG